MKLFSFAAYEELARQLQTIPEVRSGGFEVARFDNGELHIKLQCTVSGEHCLVLGTIAPPDELMLSFLLLAHTLKKEGAKHVTAILPYLAYSRQDKEKTGESLGTAWVGALLKSSGVDEVLTLDAHSQRDRELFPVPLQSLSTAEIFAEALRKDGLADATIVAPDNGAIGRCEAVKNAAGMPIGETPYFEKWRTEHGVIHRGPIGSVAKKAVIVDDMIDTGGTLISACEKLTAAGVEEIYIFVTHGLFTGSHWTKLWSLGVKRIFCADTIPLRKEIDATKISILSIAPLLKMELARIGSDSQRMAAGG